MGWPSRHRAVSGQSWSETTLCREEKVAAVAMLAQCTRDRPEPGDRDRIRLLSKVAGEHTQCSAPPPHKHGGSNQTRRNTCGLLCGPER